MKILLLNPPFLDKFSKSSRSPGVTKSATIYFPLWLSYAAGVLDKEGYELKMIDAPARCIGKDECLEEIKAFNPDFVVVDMATASLSGRYTCVCNCKRNPSQMQGLCGFYCTT